MAFADFWETSIQVWKNTMSIVLFLIISLDPIRLPAGAGANFVAFSGSQLYIMDARDGKIYKSGLDGQIRAVFDKKGFGPGEVTTVSQLFVEGDELFILDHKQRKVVITDHDFQYKRQLIVPGGGLLGTMVVMKDAYFFRYFKPSDGLTIHKFDLEMNPVTSFAGGFVFGDEVPKSAGPEINFKYGSGSIFKHDNHIFSFPGFRYRIEEYDADGKSIGVYKIPGIKISDFYEAPDGNKFGLSMSFVQQDHAGNFYFILRWRLPMYDSPLPYNRLYRFDPQTKKMAFVRAETYWQYPAHDGFWVRAVEDEKNGNVSLVFVPDPFADGAINAETGGRLNQSEVQNEKKR